MIEFAATDPFAIFTVVEDGSKFRRRAINIDSITYIKGEDLSATSDQSQNVRAELTLQSIDETEGILVAETVNEVASIIARAKRDGVGFRTLTLLDEAKKIAQRTSLE